MHRRSLVSLALVSSFLGLSACGGSGTGDVASIDSADGKTVVDLIETEGLWSVSVQVNGRPLRFVLDTGSDQIVVTPATAQMLGLVLSDEQVPGSGGSGPFEPVRWTVLAELRVGKARLGAAIAFVIPMPAEFAFEGILGSSFFRTFLPRFDVGHQELVLTLASRPTPLWPPQDPLIPRARLPLRVEASGKVLVWASVAGVAGWFSIDTAGSGVPITIFTPTVERAQLRARLQPSVRMITGITASGIERGDVARAPEVTLGPWRLERPVVDLSLATAGLFGSDAWTGNLGIEIWRRFAFSIDLGAGLITLEPNAALSDPFSAPRSGFAVRSTADGLRVIEVVPAGPAALAGVQLDDVIVAIDGQRPATAARLRQALERQAGSDVALALRESSGTEREARLVLKDLV